jgi:large subunit ribosomal protein L15
MPLQRRLPKVGFTARKSRFRAEIRLGELNKVAAEVIDIEALRSAGIISRRIVDAKVFASGQITRAIILRGISVSKGARVAIEAAKGKIEE